MKGQGGTLLIIAGLFIAMSGIYLYQMGQTITFDGNNVTVNGSLIVKGSEVCTPSNGNCYVNVSSFGNITSITIGSGNCSVQFDTALYNITIVYVCP